MGQKFIFDFCSYAENQYKKYLTLLILCDTIYFIAFMGGNMKKYNYLFEQFILANGYKKIDLSSKAFLEEFSAWLKKQQENGIKYASFLNYMGFNFDERECAEIGKGDYDSIVKPFNTSIITNVEPTPIVNPNRIINGNMRVYKSSPFLIGHNNFNNQIDQIPNDVITTYMTQNITNLSSIYGWEDLHNSGKYNIILGAFGTSKSKEEEYKKMIEIFKDKLNGNFIEESCKIEADDLFMYAIGSDRLLKTKEEKVLKR